MGEAGHETVLIFEFSLERLRALPVITKNPRPAAQPQTDLASDSLCVLRRRSPAYQALFFSRIKLIFNMRCHQKRGWEAVAQCALFAVIAMLSVSLGGGQDRSSGEAPLQLDLDQPNLSGPWEDWLYRTVFRLPGASPGQTHLRSIPDQGACSANYSRQGLSQG
jgi:hypothetical protein